MIFPDIAAIKQKRSQLNITQKQLAAQSGLSQSAITKIESKRIEPSYSTVKKIFDSFDSFENQKQDRCSQLMHKKLFSIKSNETIKTAADAMKKNAVSQLPVFDKNRLVGHISEEIIYNRIMEEDKSKVFKKQVKEIMKDPLPTINAATPIKIAMPLLKTNPAILLTDKDKIVGILTKEDLL